MVSPLKLARPAPLVVAVAFRRVPEPVVTLAVTRMPDSGVGFPFRSVTWMTGCTDSGAPFCAEEEGWVATWSRPAAPALAVAEKTTGGIADDAICAVRVYWMLAVVPRVQLVT